MEEGSMTEGKEPPPDTRALRRGESGAWNLLYADLAPRVLGYLLRLGVARHDAEDVVQETFLAAFDGRKSYASRSLPLAWLLGIARRRWRDKARGTHPTDEPPADLPDKRDVAGEVVSDATAEGWLSLLPVADREIIVLSVLNGLSYREIADITGKPLGTVKWRAAESLKRLRALVPAEESHHEQTELTRPERPDGASADRKFACPVRVPPASPDCP